MKKLNLNDLKVESFVTSLEDKNSQTIKGGTTPTTLPVALDGSAVALMAVASVTQLTGAILLVSVMVDATINMAEDATNKKTKDKESK